MSDYLQKILFGGPGVGKSYMVSSLLEPLNIHTDSENFIPTVFHPEYTYGDFIGKLLPLTQDNKVTYKYYAGHFLKAISQAYKNILINPESPENVALIIDEINRGNSASIFGTIFQLLDRNDEGWSCYQTNISEMEFKKILELVDINTITLSNSGYKTHEYEIRNETIKKSIGKKRLNKSELEKHILEKIMITNDSIRIPPNLSIIATMNTSDNSIFYMDSAFKRRWDWEFISGSKQNVKIEDICEWPDFIDKLNYFIIKNHKSIRQIEDKQIGYWFIKPRYESYITKSEIKNKLMFFLWDSVFNRDKSCLSDLLDLKKEELITFKNFSDKCDDFIIRILDK